jgi:hypothetical protein
MCENTIEYSPLGSTLPQWQYFVASPPANEFKLTNDGPEIDADYQAARPQSTG